MILNSKSILIDMAAPAARGRGAGRGGRESVGELGDKSEGLRSIH